MGLFFLWTLVGSLGVTYANTSASTLYFCRFDGVFVILLLWYTIIIILILISNSGYYKNPRKELSFCHKLKFSNSYNLATRFLRPLICQTNNSVISNSLSLKYQRFTPSGCKDIGVRKYKFVAKTQLLC